MNNRYPRQRMAKQIESYGRNGDSVLVHMNPIEVAGIASLSPGGLTTNPDTGQPEAANFLKTLVPMLASYGGAAALTAATGGAAAPFAVAMAGGLSSGLATGAMTGDWERGLASGVMGAGIGGAMSGIGGAAAEGALGEAAGMGAEQLAIDSVGQEAGTLMGDMAAQEAAATAAQQAAATEMGAGLGPTAMPSLPTAAAPDYMTNAATQEGASFLGNPTMDSLKANYGESLAAPFQKGSGAMEQIMKPSNMMPMVVGASELARMDAEAGREDGAAQMKEESEAEQRAGFNRQQAAWRKAQPNTKTGISALRGPAGMRNPWMPPGMAQGGIVGYAEGTTVEPVEAPYSGAYGPGRLDPVEVQAALRGQHKVKPPSTFRPGFDPEFDYFQDYDKEGGELPIYPDPTTTEDWLNMYPPFKTGYGDAVPEASDDSGATNPFDNVDYNGQDPNTGPVYVAPTPPPIEPINPLTGEPYIVGAVGNGGYKGPPRAHHAAGGDVTLNTDLGPQTIAGGGIAGVETPYTAAPPQAPMPTPQELQMVTQAVTGQAGPQADQIIEQFVQKYGPETFRQVREMILQSMAPGAQTEGMIQGQGGGMDDKVMGTIGGQQEVAVSPGEYIVPADVVSGLGDGSSDAGSAELDQMMDNVRMARGGNTTQPPPFNARKVLPA